MLAVETVLLEIGEARGGGGDEGERLGGQVPGLEDCIEGSVGRGGEELLDGAADIGGGEGLDAGAVAEMAVPVAAETRERLDDRNTPVRGGAEARPVAAAEDADHGPADGGSEVEGAGVVADVKVGRGEQGGEDGDFAVAAEPDGGAFTAETDGFGGDGFQNGFFRFVAEEENGQAALALEPEHDLGEFCGGPGFDLDVGETGGEDGGETRGRELRGGEDGRGRGGSGGGDRDSGERAGGGSGAREQVIDEAVLVLPVGGAGGGGDGFRERGGDFDAEIEPERGGEDRVHVLPAEHDAADFGEMRGDGGFEPGAVERGREDQVGREGGDLAEERGEFGAALGGFLFEGVEPGDVPVERRREERRERLVARADDEGVAGVGPRGLELGERRGEDDEVADGIGTQVDDALGRYGHGKGLRQRKAGRRCEPDFNGAGGASGGGLLCGFETLDGPAAVGGFGGFVEESLDQTAGRAGGEGGGDLLGRAQRERGAGGGEKHIVAINGVREIEGGETQPREKFGGAAAAEEVEVLVVVAVHVALENVAGGDEVGVGEVLFVFGRLDDEEAFGREEAGAVGEGGGGRGQVFEDVVEDDHVETAGREGLRFDGAGEGVDVERLSREVDDPRAHLGAGGGVARPAEEGDVGAVGAAEFEHPGGREAACEEMAEPVGAALGQIEPGAARDVGQAVVLGLALVPVVFGVKFAGVGADGERLGRQRGAADERAAGAAHVVIGRVGREFRVAAPAGARARRSGGGGVAGAHA